MHDHCKVLFGATKRVLRYIRRLANYGIQFNKGASALHLFGNCDSNGGGCRDDYYTHF